MSPNLAESILAICGILGFFFSLYNSIFKSGKKESNLNDRVVSLENNSINTSKDINDIKTNHLAHIQADMNEMKINIAEISTTLKIRFEDK